MCETGFNQVFVWGFGSRFDDRIAFPAFERSFGLLKRDLDLFIFSVLLVSRWSGYIVWTYASLLAW